MYPYTYRDRDVAVNCGVFDLEEATVMRKLRADLSLFLDR